MLHYKDDENTVKHYEYYISETLTHHLSLFQGDQYWRLDRNMVMEPGYPKPLSSEFPGLTGSISAVLAVPATRTRPETVFFFKKGEQDGHTAVTLSAFVQSC